MSLEGIFDPMVRAYFAGQCGGGSDNNSGNSRQAVFTIQEETQAFVFVPPIVSSGAQKIELEGMVFYKVCDEMPNIPESVGWCTVSAQNLAGDVETIVGKTSDGNFTYTPGQSLAVIAESGLACFAAFSELAAMLDIEAGFYLPERYGTHIVTLVIV